MEKEQSNLHKMRKHRVTLKGKKVGFICKEYSSETVIIFDNEVVCRDGDILKITSSYKE